MYKSKVSTSLIPNPFTLLSEFYFLDKHVNRPGVGSSELKDHVTETWNDVNIKKSFMIITYDTQSIFLNL